MEFIKERYLEEKKENTPSTKKKVRFKKQERKHDFDHEKKGGKQELDQEKKKENKTKKKASFKILLFFYKFLPQISLFAYERKLVEQDETSLIFRRGLKENYAAHLKDFFCLRADYHFINAHLNY